MYFILQHFFLGFFVKAVASFDDTLTRIPIISLLTKTLKGKIAFSIGTLLALSVILIFTSLIYSVLELFPYKKYLIAGLIFILAILVYFGFFIKVPIAKVEKLVKPEFTTRRFLKLLIVGFVISFVTLIDDSLVLVPLFLEDRLSTAIAISGVYAATLIQIAIVIYFGEKINNIRFKREISSGALILLSVLILLGVF
jgi:hypothetical protein